MSCQRTGGLGTNDRVGQVLRALFRMNTCFRSFPNKSNTYTSGLSCNEISEHVARSAWYNLWNTHYGGINMKPAELDA